MTSSYTRLALAFFTACVVFPASAAASQSPPPGEDAGSAVVVDAVNTDRGLTEFDSTAAFRLRLPDGATCPGDSANDDYRVQTFLVPDDTDLSTLKYRSRSPDGNDLYRALRYVDGEVATQAATNQNAGPGDPALVLESRLPFTFAHFSEGSLPPGRWFLGIACTPQNWYVDKYWDVEVLLEAAPDVVPGGLLIRVMDDLGSPASSDSGSNLPALPVLIGAALAIGAIAVIAQRFANSKISTTKESS